MMGAPPDKPTRRSYLNLMIGGAAFTLMGAVSLSYALRSEPKKVKDTELDALRNAQAFKKPIPVQPAAASTGALSKDEFLNFKLKEVKPYNHNTSRFIFELPDGKDSGLTIASAILVKSAKEGAVVDDKGKPVIRPYTPVTAPSVKGRLDLLIKKYKGGKMTEHIHSLKPGDELAIKGPIPKFPWKANQFESIGMVAGGSGITPMWQVMQTIDSNKDDKTKVVLLFSNVTEQDILLRKEFDDLAKRKPNQFKIVYNLDKPPKGWKGETGYIDRELLLKHLPMPNLGDKIKVFVCGPPPQVERISGNKKSPSDQGELKGYLADLGYAPDQVYKF